MTRTTRTAAAVLGAACLLSGGAVAEASAAPPDTPPESCAVEQLPLPGGAVAGRVTGSDPTGEVLLGSTVTGSELTTRPVIWRNGPTIVDAQGDVVDMNADGVAVGTYLDDRSTPHSWVYDGNEVRPLAGEAEAYAINDDGRIVGNRMAPTPNGPPVAVPVTWPSASEEPVDLAPLEEGTGIATAISEDGTIVGTFDGKAVVWHPDGSREGLPLPEGVPADAPSDAVAINGPWVAGTVGVSGEPVRWNLDTGAVKYVEAADEVSSINERGWVVGRSELVGVLSTGDTTVDLLGIGEDDMSTPVSISPDARVIGGTSQPRGNPSPATEVPVRWNCA